MGTANKQILPVNKKTSLWIFRVVYSLILIVAFIYVVWNYFISPKDSVMYGNGIQGMTYLFFIGLGVVSFLIIERSISQSKKK